MDSTIILARVSGLVCLLVGLSVMNRRNMSAVAGELEQNKALLWFSGFIAAVLGSIILAFYSSWDASWRVLITILGWLSLLKGIVIMLSPASYWHSIIRRSKTNGIIVFSGTIAIIFGIILLYQGFRG